jgi:hypothetical protein
MGSAVRDDDSPALTRPLSAGITAPPGNARIGFARSAEVALGADADAFTAGCAADAGVAARPPLGVASVPPPVAF